jgi:type IV pilus assembly protein PilB
MGVEPYLVGSSVTCVVAQRLARRLCEECKVPFDSSTVNFEDLGFPYNPADDLYAPSETGCSSCASTGFRGRVALIEVMEMNQEIEHLVNERASARVIRNEAEKHGLVPLRKDGWTKVKEGITTIAEVMRVTS